MQIRKTYLTEFRAEAATMTLERGPALKNAAKKLAAPKGTLPNWLKAAKAGISKPAPGARSVAELGDANAHLRKKNSRRSS